MKNYIKYVIWYFIKYKIFRIKDKPLFKPNTVVVFDYDNCPPEHKENYLQTFPKGRLYIYLGDITNAPGHCILLDIETKEILTMWHTDNFRIATDDEF